MTMLEKEKVQKKLGERKKVLYVDPPSLGIQRKVQLRHTFSGHGSREDSNHFAPKKPVYVGHVLPWKWSRKGRA
jgi:hypothetical protein